MPAERKFAQLFEEKSSLILSISVILQCAISVLFLIGYFYLSKDVSLLFKIYSSILLFIFSVVMVHFAHHSIKRANEIELFAFLLMGTFTTIILVCFLCVYGIVNKDEIETVSFFKKKYFVIAIIFIIISLVINIVYYICSYYCYQTFTDISFANLGTKKIYHEMFRWCKFQVSVVKTDTALVLALFATSLIFNHEKIFLIVFDTICIIFSFVYIFILRYSINNEKKDGVIFPLLIRLLIQVYIIFRMVDLIIFVNNQQGSKFLTEGYGVPVTISLTVVNCLLVILELYTSYRCYKNFNKGLPEMMRKQVNDTDELTSELTDSSL